MAEIVHTIFPELVSSSSGWLHELRQREENSWNIIRNAGPQPRHHLSNRATYLLSDVLQWLSHLPDHSIHAVVTDPPYGMIEYEEKNHSKMRQGRGGVENPAQF